jgi:CRISPR-associated exonuclease Cas4
LIGRNDAGKSSILRAVELLLDPIQAPTARDLCSFQDGTGIIEIYAEIVDVPESHPLSHDGSIKLRRRCGNGIDICEFEGVVPVSNTLKAMAAGTLTKTQLTEDKELDIEVRAELNNLPDGKVQPTWWKEKYLELDGKHLVPKEPGWQSIAAKELSELFDVVFLTADMRAQEESADSQTSVFGKLGGILFREACRAHPELLTARGELERVLASIATRDEEGKWSLGSIQRLEGVLQEEVHRFDPRVTVKPTATAPTVPKLDFRLGLDVKDEHVEGVTSMGHGLRRSLVFAMLRALGRMQEIVGEEPADTIRPLRIFLVEEPELYLHPQAERARMRELRELSELEFTQVIACTHSAFFIDMSRYRSIIRLERVDRNASRVWCWSGNDLDADEKEKLKAIRAMHPTSAAALFADLAILAEGPTEVGCLPHLAERIGLDAVSVEIVDCGGAGSVPMLARVCDAFGIKYTTWFDQDRPDDIAKAIGQATAGRMALIVLDPDWEAVAEVPAGAGGKPWRSYSHFVLNDAALPANLEGAIRAAYDHTSLDMRP